LSAENGETYTEAYENYTQEEKAFTITNGGNRTITNLTAYLGSDFEFVSGYAIPAETSLAVGGSITVRVRPAAGKLSTSTYTGDLSVSAAQANGTTALSGSELPSPITLSFKVKADKSGLQSLYSTSNALNEGDYTESSWLSFDLAKAGALNALNSESASQADIDTVLAFLQEKKDQLVLRPSEPSVEPPPAGSVESLKINAGATLVTVNKGRAITLNVTITPSGYNGTVEITNANSIVASVSDSVAIVNSASIISVTGLKAGITILTFNCNGKKATITVRVA
jgi:hypothetical protein